MSDITIPITAVANAVSNGFQFLNDRRRHALAKDHREALQDLNDAENAHPPHYNDDDLILAQERLSNFMVAFGHALGEQKAEEKKGD